MDHNQNIVIAVRNLCKSFTNTMEKQTVLDQVNLDIFREDFTVVMGASGSGKSTLLYCLSGMDKPTSGQVVFSGNDLTRLSEDQRSVFRRKHCGFVFQQIYLLEGMSLMDNVLAAGLLGLSKRKPLIQKAQVLFKQVDLSETIQHKLPSQISGGEAQRAGIVRAVINNPRVVFADEPTGALNSQNSSAVLDILTSLHFQGQTVVMVTHDKQSALRGNRILYVKDGRIYGEIRLGSFGSDEEFRKQALNTFLSEMGW